MKKGRKQGKEKREEFESEDNKCEAERMLKKGPQGQKWASYIVLMDEIFWRKSKTIWKISVGARLNCI